MPILPILHIYEKSIETPKLSPNERQHAVNCNWQCLSLFQRKYIEWHTGQWSCHLAII